MASLTTDGKICIEREIPISSVDCLPIDIISCFDIIDTSKWITDNNFEKVCLQFPDDLLSISAKVYVEIKKRTNADLYILGDTSYASCCVDAVAAMHVQGEAVVHYGHTCFSKTNIPVHIVLPKQHLNLEATKNMLRNLEQHENLCLFYDTEYTHCKDEIIKIWFELYPQSYIADVILDDSPLRYCGRVIRSQEKEDFPVETIKNCVCIYIGTRSQTLFNFTISIPAIQWFLLDVKANKIESMNETMWLKRRRFLIEKCKDANTIGILICKLAGDQTKDIINRMKQLCKVNGKKSYIVSVGKPNVAKLANFPEIDIYVMIACPENDLYSNRDFYKPIVYPIELETALNSNREPFSNYHITDYDELLPGKKHYCDIGEIKEETDVSLITGKIRELKTCEHETGNLEVAAVKGWALENIGDNLQDRSWRGLEQRLGETEVKKAEQGRKGIPLHYNNEPE